MRSAADRDRRLTAAGHRGRATATTTAVIRVGGEQGDAEDGDGRGDGGEQRDRRQPVVGVPSGRRRPEVPLVARRRRLVVGRARTVDHSVAHQPGGQAQALVARTGESAFADVIVRCPPGRAQRDVRAPR